MQQELDSRLYYQLKKTISIEIGDGSFFLFLLQYCPQQKNKTKGGGIVQGQANEQDFNQHLQGKKKKQYSMTSIETSG